MKTAVVVVHGVCPHPRYEIQDAFASGLSDALSNQNYLSVKWKSSILWPAITRDECGPEDVHASALRICAEYDDPANPTKPVFDIYEGYWSPIDKNQTNVASVLTWLLRSLFQPLNGYAKLWATPKKTLFDIAYLTLALTLIVSLIGTLFWLANSAWRDYVQIFGAKSQITIFDLLLHPISGASGLGARALLILLLAIVAGYGFWTFLFSLTMDVQRSLKKIRFDGSRTVWRHYLQTLLLILAVICFLSIIYVVPVPSESRKSAIGAAFFVVASVGALKAILALVSGFLINFLGDVQIYCTHDENAQFYGLREKIVQTVENVILEVLRIPADRPPHMTQGEFKAFLAKEGQDAPPLYDKIFVAAHSLGSTISMDAILNIHEMAEEYGLDTPSWRRLRGLITFGTSLEKTRFFFDVRNPSLSASMMQWRDDVYGHLFSESATVLRGANNGQSPVGIYWANYWYEWDLVANQIASYESTVPAGTEIAALGRTASHVVCNNARLKSRFQVPSHVWVHGDYLGDAALWNSGLDRNGNPYVGVADLLTGTF